MVRFVSFCWQVCVVRSRRGQKFSVYVFVIKWRHPAITYLASRFRCPRYDDWTTICRDVLLGVARLSGVSGYLGSTAKGCLSDCRTGNSPREPSEYRRYNPRIVQYTFRAQKDCKSVSFRSVWFTWASCIRLNVNVGLAYWYFGHRAHIDIDNFSGFVSSSRKCTMISKES